jgi:hypothetical protein
LRPGKSTSRSQATALLHFANALTICSPPIVFALTRCLPRLNKSLTAAYAPGNI